MLYAPAFNFEPLAETGDRVVLTVDDLLFPYVWVFYAAFLVSFFFTPVMRRLAIQWGVVDNPDGLRKIHREPVAYLGGVAVFLGWISAMAVGTFCQWHIGAKGWFPELGPNPFIPPVVVAGATMVVLLGLYDDIRGAGPYIKILGQVVAAGALLWAGIGWGLTDSIVEAVTVRLTKFTGWEFSPELLSLLSRWSSAGLTVALVVFCCNASNLMDGLDGLCGGVTAIIAVALLLVAIHLAQYPQAGDAELIRRDAMRVIFGLALVGAVLGFVPFNFNPASIFMGDAGSLFLGFTSALSIILLGEQDTKWLLAGMVIFALPTLDTALAFARRKLAGRPLFSPDKQHLHHQLVSRGLSVKQSVLIAYALAVFFALCGLSVIFMRTRYVVAMYLVLFCFIIVAAYKMGMIHERARREQGQS